MFNIKYNRREMRKLLITLLLLVSFSTTASHLSGGDIQYRYIGDSTGVARQYEVLLRIYRDQAGIPMGNTQTVYINSSCYSQQSLIVTLLPGSGGIAPTLFDCVVPSSTTKTLEIYAYKGVVTLPGNCSNFNFSWNQCCRPGGIDNINTANGFGSSGFYFDATLNNTKGQNSSPIFVSEPVRAFCVNNPFNWKQTVIEANGDSIHFSMIKCREDAYPGTDINFDAGWTAAQPITSTYFNINSSTGLIQFLPTMQEIDVASILVEEYRYDSLYGVWYKIGSASRDMMIQIEAACSPSVMNGVGLDYSAPGHYIDTATGLPTVDYNCGDTAITMYFDIMLDCFTISPDGTDFRLTSPNGQPWAIKKIVGNCNVNGETDSLTIILRKPIAVNGKYYLYSKVGNDGNTLFNKCGIGMDEFDTLVLNVEDCMDLVMELDNVTIVNNNHPQVQWSVDTTTFFKDQFDRYVILREDVAWAPVGFVYDVDKLYYDNLSANDVTNTVYNYRVYMEYNSFNMDTTREVHSIVLESEGDCDTLCLRWNSYNGWDSATYDIFVEDGSLGWIKLNSLPIEDTTYCGNFDTLSVGFNFIKVTTTNGIDTSESNYVMCNQPAPPEVVVPNVLTPNGDGVNDIFTIDYINLYDARELIVFNRWGTPVYQSDDYQNDWDGGNVAGGVYFYVLDLWKGNVGNHYYGTITIIR
jgi:gliding motility-associated-like protein